MKICLHHPPTKMSAIQIQVGFCVMAVVAVVLQMKNCQVEN